MFYEENPIGTQAEPDVGMIRDRVFDGLADVESEHSIFVENLCQPDRGQNGRPELTWNTTVNLGDAFQIPGQVLIMWPGQGNGRKGSENLPPINSIGEAFASEYQIPFPLIEGHTPRHYELGTVGLMVPLWRVEGEGIDHGWARTLGIGLDPRSSGMILPLFWAGHLTQYRPYFTTLPKVTGTLVDGQHYADHALVNVDSAINAILTMTSDIRTEEGETLAALGMLPDPH
ncbi:hypothetical protein HOD83_02890 [Candidatus Woesearchaeota archaeon]|nr:hypothetical protein [Candidatus Woesearchaeota archaeon]MBT4114608.1 hypothetical protein [Candidatus Woesearchaeota archaeon]MBT4248508.1 hypothetical protein [Candidatus Woesearchaeota archaeon]